MFGLSFWGEGQPEYYNLKTRPKIGIRSILFYIYLQFFHLLNQLVNVHSTFLNFLFKFEFYLVILYEFLPS